MGDTLDLAILTSIFAGTIRVATPLLFAAIGELVTQRAGIWNMGVEGTMLMGAFAAYLGVTLTGSLWLGMMAAIMAGALMGVIVGFLTATLRVDHFIAGLALNLMVAGLTPFWFRTYVGTGTQPTYDGFDNHPIPFLSQIPVLGEMLFDQRLLTYVAFLAVPLVWAFLYRTRWGLELRALGENPRAIEMRGLNVAARQYGAVLFGSMMTGLGGGFLVLSFSDRFLADLTAGRGWLAIVALIAGNWMPRGVLVAVLVFALLDSIATHVQVLGLPVPHQIFLALPFVVSLLMLMSMRRRTRQPARLGIPYFR